MTQAEDRERDDRAWLCERIAALRRCDRTKADELADREQDGEDVTLLRREMEAEEACPRTTPGPARGDPRLPSALPIGPLPSTEVFVCPDNVCARVVARRPGVRAPQCVLRGARMLLIRF